MVDVYHSTLSGADLHAPGYVGSADPGAVGAGHYWVDTSGGTGKWALKVRNAANTAWEVVGAIDETVILSATDPGAVGAAKIWFDTDDPLSRTYVRKADNSGWSALSRLPHYITNGPSASVAKAVWSTLPLNTSPISMGGDGWVNSGWVVIVPATGFYFIHCYLGGGTTHIDSQIIVNGAPNVLLDNSGLVLVSGSFTRIWDRQQSGILFLNAGDQIAVQAFRGTGATAATENLNVQRFSLLAVGW